MPLTSVSTTMSMLVRLEDANVAVSNGPLGTVLGVQLAAVNHSPLAGLCFQVALPAKELLTVERTSVRIAAAERSKADHCLLMIFMVCMGFSWFGFCFGFPGSVVVPVHVLKRKARLKPATTAQFFWIASRPCCKNPSTVLECAASSSLYDDAPIHATRGHPTAWRLERRRRGSAGEIVSTGATRIAPTRTSLHEPGARRPHPANHRHSQRSLPAAGR